MLSTDEIEVFAHGLSATEAEQDTTFTWSITNIAHNVNFSSFDMFPSADTKSCFVCGRGVGTAPGNYVVKAVSLNGTQGFSASFSVTADPNVVTHVTVTLGTPQPRTHFPPPPTP